MPGGISSFVHRISVRLTTGSRVQVVLKRSSGQRWGGEDTAVGNEAAALAGVEGSAIPAPRLLAVSADGSDSDGEPSLLMTRAPGHVWLTPPDLPVWAGQLATLLPTLHQGTATVWAHTRRDAEALTLPASAQHPQVWAAARDLLTSPPPQCEPVFAHGDYQHFNALWSRGRLSALVDWSGACVAPRDVDVGHCRLNLAVLFSVDLAERFRLAYEAEAGRRVEPWWDIHQLLAFGDDWTGFIPVQVAGRAPLDVAGMTGRVERLLALALERL
jgi:aminoglycoside phosphotransferase (APT) family kinase protein